MGPHSRPFITVHSQLIDIWIGTCGIIILKQVSTIYVYTNFPSHSL